MSHRCPDQGDIVVAGSRWACLFCSDRVLVREDLPCGCEILILPLRNGLPNVNGGEKPPTYKGVLKENEAP